MKNFKTIFVFLILGITLITNGQTNVYNSDEALETNRTVEQNSNFFHIRNLESSNFFVSGDKFNFVGIGTMKPTVKIDVIGTLRAKNGYFENIINSGFNEFANYYQYVYNSHVLGAGFKMGNKIDSIQSYRYNFNVFDYQKGYDNVDDFVHVNIVDRRNLERFIFNTYSKNDTEGGGSMRFQANNFEEKEIFKLSGDKKIMFSSIYQ